MPFQSRSIRKPPKNQIFCVGWTAFVSWTPRDASPVPAMDGAGTLMPNDLCDGQEVEILSWRPRSSLGLLYQVRRLRDGSEWWIAATNLRANGAGGSRDGAVR